MREINLQDVKNVCYNNFPKFKEALSRILTVFEQPKLYLCHMKPKNNGPILLAIGILEQRNC